jgi:hypothetical protein
MTPHEKELLANTDRFYRLQFKNVGGLVMPVIVLMTLQDGTTKEIRLPAEVWRVDSNACDTLVITDQPILKFELDPYRETADINRDNNHFPPTIEPTRFQLFKSQRRGAEDNPMAQAKRAKEAEQKAQEQTQSAPAAESKPEQTPTKKPESPKKKKKNKLLLQTSSANQATLDR